MRSPFRSGLAGGLTGMVVSNLFFSVMAILVRLDLRINGLEAAFYRFAVGGFVVVSLALIGKTHLRFRDMKGLLWRGLVGGLSVMLFYLPISHIGLGKTSLFQYTYPFYAILFSAIFLGERLNRTTILLTVAALAGLILLEVPSLRDGAWNWWVVSAWASGVLSGLAVMYIKKLSTTETSTAIFLAQCIGGFWIVLIPANVIPSPAGWGPGVLLLAIGLTATVGQLLMTWSYKHVDVTTGSLLGTLVPVLNVAAGIFFFGESFRPLEAMGATITLAACILLVVARTRKPRTTPSLN